MRLSTGEAAGRRHGMARSEIVIVSALAGVLPLLVAHGFGLFEANANAARSNQALAHAETTHFAISAAPSAPQLAFPLSITEPQSVLGTGALFASR